MERKILSLLGLCQRAGKLVSGELSCITAIRNKSAKLIILANDASENTVKKFSDKTCYYNIKLCRISTKFEIGKALGKKERTIVAITDKGFAEEVLKILNIQ